MMLVTDSNVTNLLFLSPTSKNDHQQKITMSPISLSPTATIVYEYVLEWCSFFGENFEINRELEIFKIVKITFIHDNFRTLIFYLS